jgi:hypothetical protein
MRGPLLSVHKAAPLGDMRAQPSAHLSATSYALGRPLIQGLSASTRSRRGRRKNAGPRASGTWSRRAPARADSRSTGGRHGDRREAQCVRPLPRWPAPRHHEIEETGAVRVHSLAPGPRRAWRRWVPPSLSSPVSRRARRAFAFPGSVLMLDSSVTARHTGPHQFSHSPASSPPRNGPVK